MEKVRMHHTSKTAITAAWNAQGLTRSAAAAAVSAKNTRHTAAARITAIRI